MQSTSLSGLSAFSLDGALPSTERPSGKRLIRTDTVLAKVPWSRTTLWRRIKDGDFPPPIRISGGLNAWLESSVDAWIDARMAGAGE